MNSVTYIKVSSLKKSDLNILKTPVKQSRDFLCAGKIFRVCSRINRLMGLFPFTWEHTNGNCICKKSRFWMTYSLVLITGLLVTASTFKESLKFSYNDFPELLESLISMVNSIYVSFTVLVLWKVDAWVAISKALSKLNTNYLFCQQSRKITKDLQFKVIMTTFVMIVLQILFFVILKCLFTTSVSISILFFRNLQMVPFFNFSFWITCMKYFISMFVCFENVVVHYLDYQPSHPSNDIDLTHNKNQFFGLFKGFSICDGKHYLPEHLQRLSKTELIEYLRRTHEEMYQVVLMFQNYASDLLLFYIIAEIAVMIISCYSIIVHIVYRFGSPVATTTLILNVMYVVWHTTGLFWFFKNLQFLKQIIHGLRPILVEYLLRGVAVEEHQQIRIFITKISCATPLSVSELFEIDLGIVGPLAGNVFTYVLVALQFQIPPQNPLY